MQNITKLSAALLVIVLAASCNSSKKDDNAALNDKKVELEKLKKEKSSQDGKIKALENDIARLDTNATKANAKLVAIAPVSTQDFKHYIELRGKVDADNISYISPRMGPAQVKALYVHQGQSVNKGQLLLKLDDAIIRQQVTAARQQAEGIKVQLNYAKNIAQRQQNLWDKGIGTEVQLITAKNNVSSLEEQLKAANEQTQVAVEQLKTANVYSDVTGIADEVNIRVGETFQGMSSTGQPQIKIVNTSSLKVVVNIAENYITKLSKGAAVVATMPDVNKTYNSTLSYIGQSIGLNTIGFVAEAKLPRDPLLKPNQSAVVRILDYSAPNAIVIPVNTIQTDEKGKYVFVLQKAPNGTSTAKKKPVVMGEVFGEMAEIKGGLTVGEQLITEGYQSIYEGQLISVAK
jgi:RND family efflux transporter MFP subunit